MPEIIYDSDRGLFLVSDYDGSSYGESLSSSNKRCTKTPQWNFFRYGSNHAYTNGGEVSYEENCQNNLIIASGRGVSLKNTKNSFIVAEPYLRISPIFKLREVVDDASSLLASFQIRYNLPLAVSQREDLKEKNLDNLTESINLMYGVVPRKISLIPSRSKTGGVYYVEGKDGKKYVLKYKDKDRERAELISTITNNISGFFPSVHLRQDRLGYTFYLEDGWYGLDSFVEGFSLERNIHYFSRLGSHVSSLHLQLAALNDGTLNLERKLFAEDGHLAESSVASMYLDLKTSNLGSSTLLSELDRIIEGSFSSLFRGFPKSLIHRDLNLSNILWAEGRPLIVDAESIRFSARVNEFIPPLILEGNRARPVYLDGSLSRLTDSYNSTFKTPLSQDEEAILPDLLKLALLRYYVVRMIRRGLSDEGYLGELEKTLINLKAGC
ncbi:hypothetical protein HY212_04080 [Candidatus Pacearchaeota archaeon]|nr:hypothetical protein [Candidatus Pacearchaeota archaeon]